MSRYMQYIWPSADDPGISLHSDLAIHEYSERQYVSSADTLKKNSVYGQLRMTWDIPSSNLPI